MIVSKRLRMIAALCLVFQMAVPSALVARNRKGDKLLAMGRAAEERKDWDQALDYYEQALRIDPAEPTYQIGVRHARFEGAQAHVDRGRKLRAAGQLEPALVEFDRAFGMDPSSAVALQEIQHTSEAIDRTKKGLNKPGESGMTGADAARKESETRISSLAPPPELKPITNTISALKMNNQPPRVMYETVGKLAGINVIFDPAFTTATKANLDLNNATLDQSLDYIALLTKTFWKPLTSNAIFVAEDTVQKRRDYEDQVVKVFYLRNMTSVQEFQEVITAVRSVTDIRRMFPFNAQTAVVARGSVDQIALAEKLFHDLDKPKAEVVVDVVVLEANRDHTRNLALGLTSGGTTGLQVPISFTGTTPATTTSTSNTGTSTTNTDAATTASGSIGLSHIGSVNFSNFQVSLPGALLQAILSDNQTRVLQSPQVRASDGQKVSLKIGDKVPYATGSYNTGTVASGTAANISPLVSTQFNFYDTGVNVDMTPHVHGNDEITLDVTLEISNVANQVNVGGINEPEISQRKNDTHIRVRNGEVNLLGGLMQAQDTKTTSGIPGFYNVPVLGQFIFGSNNRERTRGELLIALIPHIVRTPNITELDMRGVAAGTEQVVKMSYERKEEPAPAAAPGAPAVTPGTPAATPQAPVPAMGPGGPLSPSSAVPAPGGPVSLMFNAPTLQAAVSTPVLVTLNLANANDVAAAPVRLKWDPKILRLNSITPGTLLTAGDGAPPPPPSIEIRNDTGEALISQVRHPGVGGVNGNGALAMFNFVAVGKGQSPITVVEAPLLNSKGERQTVKGPTMTVTVQ